MSQLNFEMHCAMIACRLFSEHLFANDRILRSIYCFYVVFQTHKIQNTLGIKFPYADAFDPFKCRYNPENYRKLCEVFNVEPSTNCWYKYDQKRFIQDGKTGHYVMANSVMGWIQDHNFGLSKVGVQKLSESVRAYVVFDTIFTIVNPILYHWKK